LGQLNDNQILSGAEPLFLEGKKTFSFLFLHGFKATTYELKEFAQTIHSHYNATVYVPLLAGHGVNSKTMNQSTWHDWYKTACDAFKMLRGKYESVYVIGMSMGGSLALHLATEFEPKAVVCIGSPLRLKRRTNFACMISWFKRSWDDSGGADIADQEQAKKVVRLDEVPLVALVELQRFLKVLRSRLHLVKVPLLLCHSKSDHVIRYRNMADIQSGVSSNHIEMETYLRSYHIIPLDYDRYALFKRSIHFFDQFIS
jgi:carboxylesterase